jgi:hypothetical protein
MEFTASKKPSAPLWIVAKHIRILNVIKPGRNPWMFKKDTCLGCPAITKGQLISECPFDVWNFPKKHEKIWQISAQESEKWSNHKIMCLMH